MRPGHARRGGFTFVELLVVIGIIGLLAAIAVGTYARMQSGQANAATDATLAKIQAALDKRAAAVVAAANKQANDFTALPTGFKAFCTNDPDRCRSVLIYMHQKVEFPTTAVEASANVTFSDLTVRRKEAFQAVTGGSPEEQSAALLYLTLTATGTAGDTSSDAGMEYQVTDTAAGRVFKDGWGRPVIYSRLSYNAAELNSPPWFRGTSAARDPNDPVGKLPGLGGNLQPFWDVIRGNHLGVGGGPSTGVPGGYDGGQNWRMTAVSSGPDKSFGAGIFDGDNLLSFRLGREGRRGN